MFCPQCGSSQSEEIKYCKQCGGNLYAVRQVVTQREFDEKFDWKKTWVAEMFLSEGEREHRKEELERQRGITPEVKRYNEIKAGVITTLVGLGVMIFLGVFMDGIVASGRVPSDAAEIISRVWIAGIIPFLVGIGLMINGTFVGRKLARIAERQWQERALVARESLPKDRLPSADRSESISPSFGVTENTTKQLSIPSQKSAGRQTAE